MAQGQGAGYDIGVSTAISASPQASAGGGNVQNNAPLFGNLFGQVGSSAGDNGASTEGGNAAAAAKGSTADASPSSAGLPTSTGLASVLPWLVLGGSVIFAVGLVAFIWKRLGK